DVVAVGARVGGGVDGDAVVHAEELEQPATLEDQRVERRQQGARCRPARDAGPGVEPGGPVPAGDGDGNELALLDELVDGLPGDALTEAEVVGEAAQGGHAVGTGGDADELAGG